MIYKLTSSTHINFPKVQKGPCLWRVPLLLFRLHLLGTKVPKSAILAVPFLSNLCHDECEVGTISIFQLGSNLLKKLTSWLSKLEVGQGVVNQIDPNFSFVAGCSGTWCHDGMPWHGSMAYSAYSAFHHPFGTPCDLLPTILAPCLGVILCKCERPHAASKAQLTRALALKTSTERPRRRLATSPPDRNS